MARVLLAERDERIRGFVAGILIEFGHEVAACADSAEASAWLARASVDVVVTDLVLRDADGVHCGQRWAALGIPTVTLSGLKFHAGEPLHERPLPLVEKPFRFTLLQSVLDAVAGCSVAKAEFHPALETAA
jgi:DNA-binding NtrC family response regulator